MIEGYTAEELLALPEEQVGAFVLSDCPIIFRVGSAEILGEFKIADENLIVELAHIDGGGEGVLPTLWSLIHRYAQRKRLQRVEWIVHAVDCANANPKLRRLLELKGFTIKDVGEATKVYSYTSNI
jgi:hypothetical protein